MAIIAESPTLVGCVLAERLPLPPIRAALYEYVLARNGLFIRGQREYLQAMLPVQAPHKMLPYVGRKVTGTHIQKPELVSSTRIIAEMPDYNRQGIPKEILIEVQQRARLNSATGRVSYSGLEPVTPFVELQPPLVPAQHVSTMLRHARNAVDPQGGPLEILFHLGWEAGSKKWRLELPLQTQGRAFVRPTNNDSGSSYARSLVDVHSHPGETASFSGGDDADETGFRLYGLLGNVRSERPLIRVRAGIYGNRWEIPAVWIFALPLNIVDCVAEVWEAARGT